MKQLYLFDEFNDNASTYGIGTYIQTLISCLPSEFFSVTIVKILYNKSEVTVFQEKTIRYIYIPHLTPYTADRTNYYRSCAFILANWIKQDENNIFHFNYITCCDLARYLKELFPLATNILTIHYRELRTAKNVEKEKKLINYYCDQVIVLSENASETLQKEYHTSENKIKVINNGVEDQAKEYLTKNAKKKNRFRYGFKKEDQILLYAGRIDSNKNPILLVKVLVELRKKYPHLHLIIAGGGNIEALLKGHHMELHYLHCTGRVSKEILYELYTLADISIIPSYYEEFPYVALEMAMFEIPVIANRTGGIPEIIKEGVNGMLLNMYSHHEENAISSLCQLISYWLDNPLKRKQIGGNARKRYESFYTLEIMGRKMMELYHSLV